VLGGVADEGMDEAEVLGIISRPGAFGIAGMRGKEKKSLIGGNTGAAAGEEPFSPPKK
jgi:hypothetical protein